MLLIGILSAGVSLARFRVDGGGDVGIGDLPLFFAFDELFGSRLSEAFARFFDSPEIFLAS